MKKICLLLSFFTLSFIVNAQNPWSLGAEYRYNPKEQDAGLRYQNFQNKGGLNLGFTYSFGMGTDKAENGFGFFAGYRYNFTTNANGNLFGGAELSLLFGNETNAKKEKSSTVTLRPDIELGYQGIISTHYLIEPGITYGYGFAINKPATPGPFDGGKLSPMVGIGYKF